MDIMIEVKWNPVTESPPSEIPIFVWNCKTKRQLFAFYYIDYKYRCLNVSILLGEELANITHWALIPKVLPPKEES